MRISYSMKREFRLFQMIMFLNSWFLIISFNPVLAQYTYQSLMIIPSQGNQYLPVDPAAQFISSSIVNSFKLCAAVCNSNTLCRIFDFSAIVLQQCRLFEGDIGSLGTIIPSSFSNSRVGIVEITPSLFTQYGQSCSSICIQSRYLTCINSTCQCQPHTYWNSSAGVCLPQSPILGASCQQKMNMCREDLNYTCLQFNQCGPLSVLSGTTIVNKNTTINGSSFGGLQSPWGLTTYGVAENESLVVTDQIASQVLLMKNVNSNNPTVSSIIRNWTSGGFQYPSFAFVDMQNANNLCVSDFGRSRIVLFSSMQINNPLLQVIPLINKTSGPHLKQFNGAMGITVDKQQNLYIADYGNNRVTRWTLNATAGIIIAGRNQTGSDSVSLYAPSGIFLDENNSLLYVADFGNHRIQVYHLNGTPPYNGTTVAGGNGLGATSNQLNCPSDVWVSKKTGAIYIADLNNHRVQRWSKGATSGVTLAGSPNGSAGSGSIMLNAPSGLAVDANETYMYVADSSNSRVQRFDLI